MRRFDVHILPDDEKYGIGENAQNCRGEFPYKKKRTFLEKQLRPEGQRENGLSVEDLV
jgi:hypothetical protein